MSVEAMKQAAAGGHTVLDLLASEFGAREYGGLPSTGHWCVAASAPSSMYGKTPLDYAEENGRTECAAVLRGSRCESPSDTDSDSDSDSDNAM